MTKEELKKEAEEYALNQWEGNLPWSVIQKSYYDGALPREKRIEELIALINAERERQEKCDDVHLRKIAELEKENAELTDELKALRESIKDYGVGCYENGLRNGKRKLEAQIEKMKCCLFCAYRTIDWNFSSICIQKDNAKIENPYTCKCEKWETKEK